MKAQEREELLLAVFGALFVAQLLWCCRRVFTLSAPELASLSVVVPRAPHSLPFIASPVTATATAGGGTETSSSAGSSRKQFARAVTSNLWRLSFRALVVVLFVALADAMLGGPAAYMQQIVEFAPTKLLSGRGRAAMLAVWWALSLSLGACLAGPVADRYGRRLACLACCGGVLLSGAVLHVSRHLATFVVNRVLGGAAAAMVLVDFEAWFVAEFTAIVAAADAVGYGADQGSAASAAVAPIVPAAAAIFEHTMQGFSVLRFASAAAAVGVSACARYVYQNHPFAGTDTAAFLLALPAGALVLRMWTENSNACAPVTLREPVRAALAAVLSRPDHRALLVVQSAVEAVAFLAVLSGTAAWRSVFVLGSGALTPQEAEDRLRAHDRDFYMRRWFPVQMLAAASGASLSGWIADRLLGGASSKGRLQQRQLHQRFVAHALLPAMIVLMLAAYVLAAQLNAPVAGLACFVLLFFAVGVSMPAAACLRALLVPEGARATTTLLLRLPLALLMAGTAVARIAADDVNDDAAASSGVAFGILPQVAALAGAWAFARSAWKA